MSELRLGLAALLVAFACAGCGETRPEEPPTKSIRGNAAGADDQAPPLSAPRPKRRPGEVQDDDR